MTALSSLAFFLSKLPLIKRLKQSVTFSPPHIIRRCTAMAPVCVCVFVFVCVCVCVRARAASVNVSVHVSLMLHLYTKRTEPVSCQPWMTTVANQRRVTLVTMYETQKTCLTLSKITFK